MVKSHSNNRFQFVKNTEAIKPAESFLILTDRMAPTLSDKEYKDFYGNYDHNMPQLREQGYTGMNVSQIMTKQLDVLGGKFDVVNSWWTHPIETIDAIRFNDDGDITIMLDAEALKNIKPIETFFDGRPVGRTQTGLEAEYGFYNALACSNIISIPRKDVIKYALDYKNNKQSKANDNLFWRVLARDEALLKEYTHAKFTEFNSEHNILERVFHVFNKGLKYPMDVRIGGKNYSTYNKDSIRSWRINPSGLGAGFIQGNDVYLIGVKDTDYATKPDVKK